MIWLCEQATKQELDQNVKRAYTQYMEALFLVKEMFRELNNTLKFSTTEIEPNKRYSMKQSLDQNDSQIASFTFINQTFAKLREGSDSESESACKNTLFDLKTSDLLSNLT